MDSRLKKNKSFVLSMMALMLFVSTGCATALAQNNAEVTTYAPSHNELVKLLEQVKKAEADHAKAKAKAPGIAIVKDGEPAATIVMAPTPPPAPVDPNDTKRRSAPKPPAGEAATLLQEWVKLMSGATLPIATEPSATGINIYVGTAAITAGLDLSGIQSESREGIRIKADDRNVYLGSQQDGHAATRAVGRFLETEFGCRYFSTKEWGRVYPKDLKTLTVMKQDFSEAPTVVARSIWGAKGSFRNQAWSSWNGEGGDVIATGHSWIFLTDADFEKNPEYYRMDENGSRSKGHWYNLGNQELRKRFIEWAVASAKNSGYSISLSPPDGMRPDYSPEAAKYDNPDVIDPSSGRVSMTDRFVGIVNEAAKAIADEGLKTKIGFYAYGDYTLPPTKPEFDKLSPNIMVNIAPIRYSRYHAIGWPHSKLALDLAEVVDGWSKRAGMLGYRTYNFNLAEMFTPFSKLSVWAHDLPYLQKKGTISYNFETLSNWELSAPHFYQSIRLSYDPTADPWLMMADYWHKFYGPAALPIQNYWMAIDNAWVTVNTEAGSYHCLPDIYTPALLAELDGHLAKAEALVKDQPDYAKRVEITRRGLTRAHYWRNWYEAINAGDIDKAQQIYDEWHAFVEVSYKNNDANQYEITYLQRFINGNLSNAYSAIHPRQAVPKAPKGQPQPVGELLPARKVIAVLPDEWKYQQQEVLDKAGVTGEPTAASYDDSAWQNVKTWSQTLSSQGHDEYIGVMWYRTTVKVPASAKGPMWLHFYKADRKITVYINGQKVSDDEVEGFKGATIDIGNHLKPGQDNQVTVRINHIPLPELNLGGIVAPIYLLEQK